MFTSYPPEAVERAEELLEFVGLYQKRYLISGDLSFALLNSLFRDVTLRPLVPLVEVDRCDGASHHGGEQIMDRFAGFHIYDARPVAD